MAYALRRYPDRIRSPHGAHIGGSPDGAPSDKDAAASSLVGGGSVPVISFSANVNRPLAQVIAERGAELMESRSGRQAEPSADPLPDVRRVADGSEGLFPGRVVAGIAKIDCVVAERSELSSKRSECRVRM